MMLPYSNETGLFSRTFGKVDSQQTHSIFKLFFFSFFKFPPKNKESIGHPYPLKEHNKPAMSFHFKFIYLWNWSFQVTGEKYFKVVHAHMFSLHVP